MSCLDEEEVLHSFWEQDLYSGDNCLPRACCFASKIISESVYLAVNAANAEIGGNLLFCGARGCAFSFRQANAVGFDPLVSGTKRLRTTSRGGFLGMSML